MKFDQARSDKIAQALIRYAYRERGRGPDGIDCVGVAILYMREFGINIPEEIRIKNWREFDECGLLQGLFMKLAPEEKLETGDIIVFHRGPKVSSGIDSVGVYLGDQRFVHAGVNFDRVTISSSLLPKFGILIQYLSEENWKTRIYAVYRARL